LAVPGALVALLLSSVGAGIGDSVTHSQTSAVTDLMAEVGLWAGLLATVVVASRVFGVGVRRDYGLALRARDTLWGVLAFGGAFGAAEAIIAVFAGSRFAGSNVQILTQQKGHSAGLIVVALLVATGAPFFEELFFRGFLRTALQARLGPHGAIWAQAVLFGFAHAGEASTALGNISVVVAMVAVGTVLGYTAKLTGRLGAGMVAHCLFNLVAVLSVI
jgi:membrane protease YdiL (CAAX protease family)